jgi:mannose-6-phosphate isomerase
VLAATGDDVPAGVAQLQSRLAVDDDGLAAERALRDVLAWALDEADAATVASVAAASTPRRTPARPSSPTRSRCCAPRHPTSRAMAG